MQEYMAIERLYDLVTDADIDVVVLDTPPSRNATDLLEAPGRLNRFLSNRILSALLSPTSAYLRAVGAASRRLLKSLGAVAGAELVDDVVTFFQAFAGMERGLAERAASMRGILSSDRTAYVIVTSPSSDAMAEALHFSSTLLEHQAAPSAFIVNKVRKGFTRSIPEGEVPDLNSALGHLSRVARDLHREAEASREAIAGLVVEVSPHPVVLIEEQSDSIHSVPALRRVAATMEVVDSEGSSAEFC
jgi:anion-transporting  ArsA/GET3 family ATPase